MHSTWYMAWTDSSMGRLNIVHAWQGRLMSQHFNVYLHIFPNYKINDTWTDSSMGS